MGFAERLRDYRIGRFTDQDVVRCTGLSVRGWRELIKFRAVRTVTERARGRGHVRLCDATVVKRAATIAAINEAGFSLAVAGQIASFLPFRTTLFEICDPRNISGATDANTHRVLPLRLRKANARWFAPNQSAKADLKADWLVQIYDRCFVSIMYRPAGKPVVFGDLRDEGATFVAWVPHNARSQFISSAIGHLAMEWAPAGERLADVVMQWEDPTKWARELARLGYGYEKPGADDPLRAAADSIVRNPLFVTTINISLAIRRAIRRYLDIEPSDSARATEIADASRRGRPAKNRRRSKA